MTEKSYKSGSKIRIFDTNIFFLFSLFFLEVKEISTDLRYVLKNVSISPFPSNKTKPNFFLETILLPLLCFTFNSKKFSHTKYDKVLQRIEDLIDKQNNEVFLPLGLQLLSPVRSGFRNLQIVVYDISRFLS